jgi:hypothetical protein
LYDSRYDTDLLEEVLKQEFGTTQRLFDAVTNGKSGTKISITATTVSDSKLCLFTNYNGGDVRKNAGKSFQ